MALRAIILDFDGTILDTETPEYGLVKGLYARHGHDLTLERWQERIGTANAWDLWAPFAAHPEREAIQLQYREDHRAAVAEEPLRPGVMRLLNQAHRAGLGLAVASSSDREWVERHLGRLGLMGLLPRDRGEGGRRDGEARPRALPPRAPPLGGAPGRGGRGRGLAPRPHRRPPRGPPKCVVTANEVTAAMPFPEDTLRLDTLEGGLATLREALAR